MNQTELRVYGLLIFHLIGPTCFAAKMIEKTKSDSPVGATVDIVKFCYGTRINGIGLVGNISDSLVASIFFEEPSLSGIILNDIRKSVSSEPVVSQFRCKLQIFIVMESSENRLMKILKEVKDSRWWNHMATFYILDSSAKGDECSRAYEFLWAAWRMNLLEAKFICTHRTEGHLIYTFNPYTGYAPAPWQRETTHRGENDHPWALLMRKYREDDREMCSNIDFDKTKDLGGYEIRTTVKNNMWNLIIDVDKPGVEAFGGAGAYVVQNFFRALNGTVKLIMHEQEESAGFMNDKGIYNGLLADTVNGRSDIGLLDRSQLSVANVTTIYPHYESRLSAITQYRGYQSQLTKISTTFDRSSRIGFCVVCLVTVICFKYFLRNTLITAVLNTIRIFLNSCLIKLPINLGPRIYLTTLFMFVVTIQGIFQGKLSALLSKRVLAPNVDTMYDLANSDHRIYAFANYNIYFGDEAFTGRFIGKEEHNCTQHVLLDASAACVWGWDMLVGDAARLKLYMSRNFIVKLYITWAIRDDWPLESRVNTIMQRIVEADLVTNSYKKYLQEPLRTIKSNDDEDKDSTHKILTIDDLSFAFVILGIGLAISTVAFLLEMII